MVTPGDDPFAMAFVLAAIAAGDGLADRAAVSVELRTRIARVLEGVRGAMQQDRAAAVAALTRALQLTLPDDAALSPRARGVVAGVVRREVGAEWMRAAPPPRPGFRTSAALKRTVVGLAGSSWDA